MNKKFKLITILIITFFISRISFATNDQSIYDKIDLFGEVLDKINNEYVEEVPEVAYEANISYARMLVRAMKYQEALPIIKAARDIKDSKGMERYYLQVERRAKKASAAKASLEAQLEARS